MIHSLKIYDPHDSLKYSILSPKVSTIIDAGRSSMPNSLHVDNTYGVDISLPDTINKDNISVVITPITHTFKITNIESSFGGGVYIHNTGYMNSGQTYYEHNKANGVMTQWVAGNLTDNNSNTFDYVAGMFPVSFWDISGKVTFDEVRLFSATCYLVYDSSTTSYKKVYSIGDDGVSIIDYIIAIKHHV